MVCLFLFNKKAGQVSHCYNRLPLLPSEPGGFSGASRTDPPSQK
ncbi:MAG: hypothetical protein NZ521_12365 [Flammeovirgaceae bacterium]|nr:hypothetical protein [Flammeovirgaceae bacterium]MDW8289053.1 hypothetical protein [Flammeovirgaceae bacterium]